jgi:hypothetical protein
VHWVANPAAHDAARNEIDRLSRAGAGSRCDRARNPILATQQLPCDDAAWLRSLLLRALKAASPCGRLRWRLNFTEALDERIARLTSHRHAVTYELLVLLREFDDRTAWNGGFASCVH